MAGQTTNFAIPKPTIGGDADAWGDEYNSGQDLIDGLLAALLPTMVQGRLTLTSGSPVMSADAIGVSSVYYTPYRGSSVPIYDGTKWAAKTFSETTLALDSTNTHTGYHQSGKVFDLFVINDSGTLRLVTGPAWSSSTARGTGAGTTELELFQGLWVNKNALSAARFGNASGNTVAVSARCATYVGSVYCTADGQTGMAFKPTPASGGTNNFLALYNGYNREDAFANCVDSTTSQNTSNNSWTAYGVSNSNRITYLDGLGLSPVSADCTYEAAVPSASSSIYGYLGMNRDSTSAQPLRCMEGGGSNNNALSLTMTTREFFQPSLGLHYIQAMQNVVGSAGGQAFAMYGASGKGNSPGMTVSLKM